ncbi:hypothetical protein HDF18_18860 [Mucilaginibacter sp. X5P1]|uniref:hypothetical protein n=1 Tax=Mucilaginibacter sp. X5P1 TaxID=2723088 RepID=UPI001619152E|nr:hypothetical protein [Mucilaginibacter sp. X5P1]MBB6139708.1 hypothetical protein [Mucilaginibacter sp. X5P1]
MKITLKKIIYLIAFIGFTLGAKAQNVAIPDTTRISLGIDGGFPNGNLSNAYNFGVGASFQIDVPLTEKLYFTGNIGYMSFFPNNNNIGSNPEAILNVKVANMNMVPVKVGLKYFLIRGFYVQAEAGESLLLNKSSIYALNTNAFTYAPQMGIVFKLHHHNYIDGGVRYERTQSFYGDGAYNNMFAVRVAYSLNL